STEKRHYDSELVRALPMAYALPPARWRTARACLGERLGGTERFDLGGRGAADVPQDGLGVGAGAPPGAGHAAVARRHAPRDADVLADPHLGMGQLDEEPALAEMRVLRDVTVGGDREGGDAGGLEHGGRLLRRAVGRPGGQQGLQLVLVPLARG